MTKSLKNDLRRRSPLFVLLFFGVFSFSCFSMESYQEDYHHDFIVGTSLADHQNPPYSFQNAQDRAKSAYKISLEIKEINGEEDKIYAGRRSVSDYLDKPKEKKSIMIVGSGYSYFGKNVFERADNPYYTVDINCEMSSKPLGAQEAITWPKAYPDSIVDISELSQIGEEWQNKFSKVIFEGLTTEAMFGQFSLKEFGKTHNINSLKNGLSTLKSDGFLVFSIPPITVLLDNSKQIIETDSRSSFQVGGINLDSLQQQELQEAYTKILDEGCSELKAENLTENFLHDFFPDIEGVNLNTISNLYKKGVEIWKEHFLEKILGREGILEQIAEITIGQVLSPNHPPITKTDWIRGTDHVQFIVKMKKK